MPRSKEDINRCAYSRDCKTFEYDESNMFRSYLNVSKKYQNRIVPAFYLFDKNGLLRHVQSGEKGFKMLEKRLYY